VVQYFFAQWRTFQISTLAFSILVQECVGGQQCQALPTEPLPMCSVYSAVSGEPLAVLETYEGISAKEMKQSLQSQIGVPRFRQKLFLEDRTQEIQGRGFCPTTSQDEAGALRILAARL
jgi:hypothetical protein